MTSKMKRTKLLLSVVLCLFASLQVYALREVNFRNYWDRDIKSLPEFVPLHGVIDDDLQTLEIFSTRVIGNICVEIIDEGGITISVEQIYLSDSLSHTIFLNFLSPGKYQVLLKGDSASYCADIEI